MEELWLFGNGTINITGSSIIPEGFSSLRTQFVSLTFLVFKKGKWLLGDKEIHSDSHLNDSLFFSLLTFTLCNNSQLQFNQGEKLDLN